jgi:4-carboxymuconolactone decarboxylase
MSDDGSDRHMRGAAALTGIHGERGMGYVANLAAFAPDFADMLVEFAYGDIYARPGLDPKSRQIATIAALTTLGGADHELEIHIRSALRVGCTKAEIIEVIMQMAVYAGFPRALSALGAARAAFADDGPANPAVPSDQ